MSYFVSAASDVDPDHIAGQRTAEPIAVVGDAVPQTTQEHAEEQPATTTAAESAEEHPALARARAGTPTRDGEAARTPPPSNVAEENGRAGGRRESPNPASSRGLFTSRLPWPGSGSSDTCDHGRG